ncbi:ARF GTPase-activating protein GIT2 [Portunus trituberculatus]|uniref:ARF GTPase-activating protein GIT2 n=1 Tax=Portunus trituberculatus TaxID=210409 RepID=A0A5B7FHQ4_PORTR|nr:ARF GTPase-activating protein GIT2 [Portunus trituberculatus]
MLSINLFDAQTAGTYRKSCVEVKSINTVTLPSLIAVFQRVSGEYDNTRARSPSLEASETTPLSASYALPTQEEVVKKTEVITKKIQELLISAQEGRQEAFMPCAEQIHSAVLDMDSIFPKASLLSSCM